MRIEDKDQQRIMSVHEWGRLAGPVKQGQWKRYRSAMESAESWFRTGVAATPDEIQDLLDSHEVTAGSRVTRVVPEVRVPIDGFPGNTRNSDVILQAVRGQKKIAISIEAKSHEPFGDHTILAHYQANPNGNIQSRIQNLMLGVFGIGIDGAQDIPENIGGLRYQLLYSLFASVVAARDRKADVAVFAVHELRAPEDPDWNHAQVAANAVDFQQFLATLPNLRLPDGQLVEGQLFGPVRLNGNEHVTDPVPLLIGKAVSVVQWND